MEHRAALALKFVPVFMGSAFKNRGVQLLLDGVSGEPRCAPNCMHALEMLVCVHAWCGFELPWSLHTAYPPCTGLIAVLSAP